MLATALMMAVALGAGDQSDPDGVVATAPETPVALDAHYTPVAPTLDGAVQQVAPHGLSTDQQINRWLESRDPANTPYADNGPGYGAPEDDGKMHGEFSATIGTGGYRDYGMAVSMPLGENGRLNLSYRQVENGYPTYGYGLGLGHNYFNDSGYVFPGRSEAGAAWDYEMRVARPGGPPMARPVLLPNQVGVRE